MNCFLRQTVRLSVKSAANFNELKFIGASGIAINRLQGVNGRNFSHLTTKKNDSVILLQSNREIIHPLSAVVMNRKLSTQPITKNLFLITEEKREIVKDPNTLFLKQNSGDRPLVVVISWLHSKQKHLMKYAQLYVDQGFDVLITQITPWQLLWPSSGTQQVASDMVKFLSNNDYYKQMVIHGFSVGGYLFGECLVHMNRDMNKYQGVVDRIVGQVWDSAADLTEIPIGVPKALFPRNPRLQAPLRNYMIYHLKTFHEAATQHYIRSSQMFHTNFVHAPALFFVSKTDPVGAEKSNRRVADSWISNGIKLTWKCFDSSPHVMHFMKHRDEYIKVLFSHLASINMVKYPEKIRAKL